MAVVPSRVPLLRNALLVFREALVAGPHRLRPIVLQSVLPGSSVSVLRHGLSDLFALPRVRAGLSGRVIRHRRNAQETAQENASEKDDPRHRVLRHSLVTRGRERRARRFGCGAAA